MAPLAHSSAGITDFRHWPDYSKNEYVLFTTHCVTREEAEMKLKVWLELLELQLRNQYNIPYENLCRHSRLRVMEKVAKTHECHHRQSCFKDTGCRCERLDWITNCWRASLLMNIKQDFYRTDDMGKLELVWLCENLASKGAYYNELTRDEYLTVRDKLEYASDEYEQEAAALRAIEINC